MKPRLSRKQWISAGLRTLSEKGVDAVRVERLADDLGVTKGSFYWHFKNRAMLLEALLEEWQTRATNDIIAQVEQHGGDAHTRLYCLFTITMDSDGRLDTAIRAWAANDPVAKAALSLIDKRRFNYLKSLFTELGFSPEQATARARFSYSAHIGQFALDIDATKQNQHELQQIFEMLVAAAPGS